MYLCRNIHKMASSNRSEISFNVVSNAKRTGLIKSFTIHHDNFDSTSFKETKYSVPTLIAIIFLCFLQVICLAIAATSRQIEFFVTNWNVLLLFVLITYPTLMSIITAIKVMTTLSLLKLNMSIDVIPILLIVNFIITITLKGVYEFHNESTMLISVVFRLFTTLIALIFHFITNVY